MSKKYPQNISYTTKHHLCTGCGVCASSCPHGAITMKIKQGSFNPVVDSSKCVDKCNVCLKVCAGLGCEIESLSKLNFNNTEQQADKYLGCFLATYSARSTDENIRYHSASGGALTQFLIYLLEKKIIDGALVVGFKKSHSSTPRTYIAKTKEEILAGKSSKYCPVSLHEGLDILKRESTGQYVIVGLPCHIQSLRKKEKIDKRFKQKVIGYFSIYCSSTPTFKATEFLFKRYQIRKKELSTFAYRDDGCLGYMKAVHSDRSETKISYRKYYAGIRSFFKNYRCALCIDHYGDLADVCFGDIQTGSYMNDKLGIGSVISRNKFFDNLLLEAKNENALILDKIEPSIVNASQKMVPSKKGKAAAYTIFQKILGRKAPKYDVKLPQPSFKNWLSLFIIEIERFVGKQSYLWFIIPLADKIAVAIKKEKEHRAK